MPVIKKLKMFTAEPGLCNRDWPLAKIYFPVRPRSRDDASPGNGCFHFFCCSGLATSTSLPRARVNMFTTCNGCWWKTSNGRYQNDDKLTDFTCEAFNLQSSRQVVKFSRAFWFLVYREANDWISSGYRVKHLKSLINIHAAMGNCKAFWLFDYLRGVRGACNQSRAYITHNDLSRNCCQRDALIRFHDADISILWARTP